MDIIELNKSEVTHISGGERQSLPTAPQTNNFFTKIITKIIGNHFVRVSIEIISIGIMTTIIISKTKEIAAHMKIDQALYPKNN